MRGKETTTDLIRFLVKSQKQCAHNLTKDTEEHAVWFLPELSPWPASSCAPLKEVECCSPLA